MEQEQTFKSGDIVWGKVNGYPWWPAKIIGTYSKQGPKSRDSSRQPVKQGHYHVEFIGHKSWSELPADKVEDFSEAFDKHYSAKDKRLRDAITETQKLLLGGAKIKVSAETNGKVNGQTKSKIPLKKAVGLDSPKKATQPSKEDTDSSSESELHQAATDHPKPKLKSKLFEQKIGFEPNPASAITQIPQVRAAV